MLIFHKYFPPTQKKTLSTSLYHVSIILILKPDKDITKLQINIPYEYRCTILRNIGSTYENHQWLKPLNTIKDKIYVIISTDAKTAFAKIQRPYIIDTLNKPGINGNSLSLIKTTTKCLITSNPKRLKIPHLRRETRQRCPLWPSLLNTVPDILAKAIKQENEMRGIRIKE